MDHVVTYNIKTKRGQHRYANYNKPTFDTNSFNLSSGTKDFLPVVTVTGFGKLRYNGLLMVMGTSGYIFQSKLYKLCSDIEGVKMYIDDILVLSKNCFRKHIEQLIIIFGRLRVLHLKVNAPKCIFLVKGYYLPRLCYNKGRS